MSAAMLGNLKACFFSARFDQSTNTILVRASRRVSSKLVSKLLDNRLFVLSEVLDDDFFVEDFFELRRRVFDHFEQSAGQVDAVDAVQEIELAVHLYHVKRVTNAL